jgi:hypothetical protein
MADNALDSQKSCLVASDNNAGATPVTWRRTPFGVSFFFF